MTRSEKMHERLNTMSERLRAEAKEAKTKTELLEIIGLEKIEITEFTKTKRAETVKEKIKQSPRYNIYTDGENMTIHSTWNITKLEITEFEKMTGLRYKRISELLDEKGQWDTWIKLEKNS